jgi:hypothetical protein
MSNHPDLNRLASTLSLAWTTLILGDPDVCMPRILNSRGDYVSEDILCAVCHLSMIPSASFAKPFSLPPSFPTSLARSLCLLSYLRLSLSLSLGLSLSSLLYAHLNAMGINTGRKVPRRAKMRCAYSPGTLRPATRATHPLVQAPQSLRRPPYCTVAALAH